MGYSRTIALLTVLSVAAVSCKGQPLQNSELAIVSGTNVSVIPPCSAPYANNQFFIIPQDSILDAFVLGGAAGVADVTYNFDNPDNGSFVAENGNSGEFQYLPPVGYSGQDNFLFTVTACDVESIPGTNDIAIYCTNAPCTTCPGIIGTVSSNICVTMPLTPVSYVAQFYVYSGDGGWTNEWFHDGSIAGNWMSVMGNGHDNNGVDCFVILGTGAVCIAYSNAPSFSCGVNTFTNSSGAIWQYTPIPFGSQNPTFVFSQSGSNFTVVGHSAGGTGSLVTNVFCNPTADKTNYTFSGSIGSVGGGTPSDRIPFASALTRQVSLNGIALVNQSFSCGTVGGCPVPAVSFTNTIIVNAFSTTNLTWKIVATGVDQQLTVTNFYPHK